jgi:8-amino-7-oxononanoate synthase
VLVGGNAAALRLAERLFARGLWAPAIRPPTVPAGTARLRISLSAAHTLEQVEALIAALRDAIDAANV